MISRDDVAYVSRLSRLDLSDDELDALVPSLQEILAYADTLNELDTSDIEPTPHVLPLRNVFQPDAVQPSLSNAQALQSAPETSDGFFLVPPVIE